MTEHSSSGPPTEYENAGEEEVSNPGSSPQVDALLEPELDMQAVRHPSEPSRFVLALVVSVLVLGWAGLAITDALGGWGLFFAVLSLTLVYGLVWFGLQIYRARLLGRAVRVTETSYPELAEVVRSVKAQLGFRRRLELYVIDKLKDERIELTSFLGTRCLVVEGSFVADLADPMLRTGARFMLASYIGSLRSHYDRWNYVVLALDIIRIVPMLWWFVFPWYRRTWYTGDRIGYACAADVTAVSNLYARWMVGPNVADRLTSDALVAQAMEVKHRFMVRLHRALSPQPHLTDRLLDTFGFAASVDPAAEAILATSLSPERFAEVRRNVPVRRVQRDRLVIAVSAAGLATAMMVAVLFVAKDGTSPLFGNVVLGWLSQPPVEPEPDPTPTPTPSPESTSPSPSADFIGLRSGIPDEYRDTCTEASGAYAADELGSQGLRAAAICEPTGTNQPDVLVHRWYLTQEAMTEAMGAFVGVSETGACSQGSAGQTNWDVNGVSRGSLACYETNDGRTAIAWTDTETLVMTVAVDTTMPFSDLYEWWRQVPLVQPTT